MSVKKNTILLNQINQSIKLTSQGKKFLKHPKSFMIVEDNEFSENDEALMEQEGGTSALDPTLNAMLVDLRENVGTRASA